MQLPLQITFRHMETSGAVAARIRERAEELARFFDRITSCRVVVECQHPRHQQGNLFRVRIDLKVPGREIVVGRDPEAHHAHEDAHVAVRDAFDAVRRLLEDYARDRRGDVKMHAVPDHGGSRGSCPSGTAALSQARTAPRYTSTATASRMAASTSWPSATRCVLSRSIPRAPRVHRRVLSFCWASITSRHVKLCAPDPGNIRGTVL